MTGEVSPVAVVELPSAAYSIDVVKRASYALMHRITVSFDLIGDHIICRLAPAGAETDLALLERDFRREVLDQDLRVSIEARTEPIRSVVLGLAFSRTGLQGG